MSRRRAFLALAVAAASFALPWTASACETIPCHGVDALCTTRPGIACAWAGRVCALLGDECA